MRHFIRSLGEEVRVHFSQRMPWVMLFAAGASGLLAAFYAHVYTQLAAVRPLLVFVLVNGELPPICGFCVLFGK